MTIANDEQQVNLSHLNHMIFKANTQIKYWGINFEKNVV